MKCPACDSWHTRVFFESSRVPVFCNVLHETRQAALDAPRGEIALDWCSHCGLIFNEAFDPSLVEYSPGYENSLHCSGRFQQFARQLTQRLVEDYQLRGKHVIEVGCGRGEFLSMLCREGNNHGIGFEPSLSEQVLGDQGAFFILPERYGSANSALPTDFLCCRHVLEHISQPLEFLEEIRNAIGPRPVAFYFEVPNVIYTLAEMGVWDIIYEHCCYYQPGSLKNLFSLAGFGEGKVSKAFGGQFLSLEGRFAPASPAGKLEPGNDVSRLIRGFSNTYANKLAHWETTLLNLERHGARVVVWGAGSKGVSFLNSLEISSQQIEYIVDLNPLKQGRFIPISAQQVMPPEFLRHYKPDAIIVMNPLYEQEVQQVTESMGLQARLLVA